MQGSNGEAQHLSHEERSRAIRLTRKTLDENGFSNIVVVAGTGAQSTRETIKLCKDAAEAGAKYALVLTPSTWPNAMTTENIIRFHTTVADNSPIPCMIYNFPTVTAGQNLESSIIGKLGEHRNIVGTKLSCGDLGKLIRLTSTFPQESFAVFPGRSDVFAPALSSGAAGLIGALVNVAPHAHVKLLKLWNDRHTNPKALQEVAEIQNILSHADAETNSLGGIGALKGIISAQFGYGNGIVRGPLSSGSPEKFALENLKNLWVHRLIQLEKELMSRSPA